MIVLKIFMFEYMNNSRTLYPIELVVVSSTACVPGFIFRVIPPYLTILSSIAIYLNKQVSIKNFAVAVTQSGFEYEHGRVS